MTANLSSVPKAVRPVTRLEFERRQRGWSQQELADRASTTRERVSLAERGETIGEESWTKLASALSIPVENIRPR